jgi:hypothetical protein
MLSCATEQKRTEWICLADLNRDSKCQVIPCSTVGEVCKREDYRIMQVYPTKMAYVYSTNPLTDFEKCNEAVKP